MLSCMKILKTGFRTQFFPSKELFFRDFDINKGCQNKIEKNNENKCSRFIDIKSIFWFPGLHRDQPPA